MKKGTLICSAGSKNDLQKMINQWSRSENWVIQDVEDGYAAYNTKLHKYSDCVVRQQGGRWRFELPIR